MEQELAMILKDMQQNIQTLLHSSSEMREEQHHFSQAITELEGKLDVSIVKADSRMTNLCEELQRQKKGKYACKAEMTREFESVRGDMEDIRKEAKSKVKAVEDKPYLNRKKAIDIMKIIMLGAGIIGVIFTVTYAVYKLGVTP